MVNEMDVSNSVVSTGLGNFLSQGCHALWLYIHAPACGWGGGNGWLVAKSQMIGICVCKHILETVFKIARISVWPVHTF